MQWNEASRILMCNVNVLGLGKLDLYYPFMYILQIYIKLDLLASSQSSKKSCVKFCKFVKCIPTNL